MNRGPHGRAPAGAQEVTFVWRPTSMPSADAFRYPNPSILSQVGVAEADLSM
jgi:hypothetical protein